MMSKQCPKCGTFLSDKDKFCPKCGWKNTSNNKKIIVIVLVVVLVVLLIAGLFIGYKFMKKRDEIINERIQNSLNLLDEESKLQDKEIEEDEQNSEEYNNEEIENAEVQEVYDYLEECPCGELCTDYDNDLDNLKNSFYPNGGATVTVEEAMQGYVFNTKKEYKNGTLFNVESTDLSMGNYEFKVFVDNMNETINFLNVLDRDNGKVYESWYSVNTN
ncbi:zinc ribbon domain-containing protein, partial [Peptacetobacter sp.]|uniref:zinc ribbon domain-containing protein n=2 Tax=Peptacetobacter sp. TaxID=2991975 RepID=UPI00261F57D4